MRAFVTLIGIVFSFFAISQEIYKPLQSEGELPEDFITLSSEKYVEAIDDLEYYSSSETSDRKEFLLQSNFSIDAMLRGGQILYNDTISKFVDEVVDIIYKANPDLPEELRFYVMRSSSTNAFSTNQGILFVTTGLISQLENEAQLAFIICHEISHYIKKHTIQSFLESKQTVRNKGAVRTYDEYVALMSKYSKNQEFEADSEGLNYFEKTPYDTYEAYTAFDVLHYSYLPFNEVPFDVDFFKSENFDVRSGLAADSINPIDVFNEDYDDSESSHPNIWKRKQKMSSLIKGDKNKKDGNWFEVGEDKFTYSRDLCRREGIRINLLQGQFPEAIYSSYLLLQENFNDPFAEISIAKALYGLHQFDAFGELREAVRKTKYVEGHSTTLFHFINELEDEELAVLAAQKVFEVSRKYPDNVYFKELLEDIIYDMVHEQEILFEDFVLEKPSIEVTKENSDSLDISISDDIIEEKKEQRQRSGKYSKIEEAKIDVGDGTSDDNLAFTESFQISYGFIHMLKDEEFRSYFESTSDEYNSLKEEEEKQSSREKWNRKKKESKEKATRDAKILREGTSLGLDNAIIYDPQIFNYDKKADLQYISSESNEVYFSEKLSKYSLERGYDYNVLSFDGSSNIDTELYNTMANLSAWSFEATRLEKLEIEMIPMESEYISSAIEDMGSRYLVLTGLIYFPEKRSISPYVWFYSAVLYPTFPVTVTAALIKKKHNIHSLKVFDLESGTLIHRSYRDLGVKQSERMISGVAYDTINQISRQRK